MTRRSSDRGARAAAIAAGLVAAAIVGGLMVGALGPDGWRDRLGEAGPGCPFRAATGVDCPFCGMTRATLALGAGDWHAAIELHPLAPGVLAGAFVLLMLVALGRSAALVRGRRPLVLLALIAAVWAVRLAV